MSKSWCTLKPKNVFFINWHSHTRSPTKNAHTWFVHWRSTPRVKGKQKRTLRESLHHSNLQITWYHLSLCLSLSISECHSWHFVQDSPSVCKCCLPWTEKAIILHLFFTGAFNPRKPSLTPSKSSRLVFSSFPFYLIFQYELYLFG